MNAIEIFSFTATQELRVLDVNGEPWFVLADLCRALDLSNPSEVSRRVREALGDDALSLSEVTDTMGRSQRATTVSEAGMYEVVIRSDKAEAVTFRRWVTSTVLPEIRRTGAYRSQQIDPTSPAGMKLVLEAATAALAALEVAQPKADAWDELASGTGDYSVADAAKMLVNAGIDTGQQRLFATLTTLGWIFRRGGRLHAYQDKVGAGLLSYKAQSHRHPDTDEVIVDAPQIRITPNGVRKLRDLIRAAEPLPQLTP